MSAIATGVIISGVLGAGAAAYGANKQAKDSAGARDATIASQQESERQNWIRYLMTRGLTPSADTQVGQVPGRPAGSAMNTKLPAWANVVVGNVPSTAKGNVPFLIRKAA